MSPTCVVVLALFGLAAVCMLPASKAQGLSQYEGGPVVESQGWDALGGLYALLAQHDALDGHALARKSVRSPSRRLRFGRRSDPEMPAQAPLDEMEELVMREVRTPVRLRFGRRSDERAVPHIFPRRNKTVLYVLLPCVSDSAAALTTTCSFCLSSLPCPKR